METNNEEQFVEFDEILNFIHENTGFDKEVIEKVLDAETRFLIKSGIATELKLYISGERSCSPIFWAYGATGRRA